VEHGTFIFEVLPMSYVSQTSGVHERVLYRTAYHWLYWLAGILLTLAPVTALAALFYGAPVAVAMAVVSSVLVPIGLFILIKAFATEIAVTTDRFVKKSGLISFQSEDMSLDKVEEIELNESVFGALLDYGTVRVRGTGLGTITVEMVQSPERLRDQIDAAREAIRVR
jgi:hypothetical protein